LNAIQFIHATGSASSQALGRSRQLAILLLAGAWCLVCFVLVTAYSSVVISFLTAPETFKPIINSINDLPMKPEIRVTVNKGWTPDKIFEVILEVIELELNMNRKNKKCRFFYKTEWRCR